MAGRPAGAPNKDKPFRDALRMELADAGENHRKLRAIASKLIELAEAGDMQAIKEIADRTDGKVPQAVVGGDEGDNPVNVLHRIERILVRPDNQNG